MKISRRSKLATIGLNMTPMIDIVFLLLIFFMTVSQINQSVSAEIRLPLVSSADNNRLEEVFEIVFTRDGSISCSGELVGPSDVRRMVSEHARKQGLASRELLVQLRVDRQCPSGVVTRVLQELASGGVERVFSSVRVESESIGL